MANLNAVDKLNNLKKTEEQDREIEKFFSEMDLPLDEIEERISLAKDIRDMYLRFFLLMSALETLKTVIEHDYWNDYLQRNYYDVLSNHGYDTDNSYCEMYVSEMSDEILTTTEEHLAQDYYLSGSRAVTIAENDTNALGNYFREIEMIKQGYTRKRWVAFMDKKTRHTHMVADGQTVDIQKPFKIGDYKMMFPMDGSFGAHAKEIINCRCHCHYFEKVNEIGSGTDDFFPITDNDIDNVSFKSNFDDGKINTEWVKEKARETLTCAKEENSSMEVAKLYNSDFGLEDTIYGTKTDIILPNGSMAKTVFLMHNHPNNKSFSDIDIIEFLKNDKLKYLSLVKNNGSVEMLYKENFNREKATIEFSRMIKNHKNDIAKDEKKGYALVVNDFLSKTKSGIVYLR